MKKSKRNDVKRFLAPLSPYKGSVALIALRAAHFGVQGSIVAIAMQHMIDSIPQGKLDVAFMWLGIMGVLFLLGDIPSYFFRQIASKVAWFVESDLLQHYIGSYTVGDNNTFESLGTGRINNILSKGISAWVRTLENVSRDIVKILISVVAGFTVVAINLGWKGFIGFFVIFAFSFIFIQFANKKLAIYRKERREVYTEQDRNIVRLIMSKFEVLQNNKFIQEKEKIASFFGSLYTMRTRESKKMVMTFDLQKFIFTLLRIGIVAYVLLHIGEGEFTVGDLALFRMLLNQIYSSIMDLNDYITRFHQDGVYIKKLWDTFDDIPPLLGYTSGSNFILDKGNIELIDLTYDYGKGEVLKNLSLSLEGGKKTAFVGISGSGKSTIIKLLAGYIHPKSGEVLIDGQPLPNETNKNYVSLKSYYKHIGYLTQEPNVFDGSIYDNLTYALDREPSEEELANAIQGAQCQFIHEFPEGVKTEIGEKGIKLSGGQRQRLAIAKVMLKDPQIILLDEPTSALDSFSEEEVTQALSNLFAGRTVIIIAHRLQTVKKADRIIVLDHGQIVEEGNHDSLVKSGGVYAKMLELQSGF